MSPGLLIFLLLLFVLLGLVSYVDRLYTEMGKFLSREFQRNVEVFEQKVEPRLGVNRDHAALAVAVLAQLALVGVALLAAYGVFRNPQWNWAELAQAVVGIVLAIVVFRQLLPFLLFSRTQGEWLVPLAPALRALIYLALPVTLIVSFCLSVAALSKEPSPEEPESPAEAVDALLEAGQEEGILQEGDRDLIQSVVEFGDKTVREVMTPRPEIMAVPVGTTVEQLTEMLRARRHSRIPVYRGSLDNIQGIVFAHDALQIADAEAHVRTVETLLHSDLLFIPESKRGSDLLREMQRENAHLAIVIDEYGGVAGLVTIEDLVEEIVGEIRDEHEAKREIVRESETSYVVPGSLDVDLLEDLFRVRPEGEATTIAGYVSEVLGRIPQAGEVIEHDGLRFEILQSTDRVVERLRISFPQPTSNIA